MYFAFFSMILGVIQLFGREYGLVFYWSEPLFTATQLNNGFITVPIYFRLIKSVNHVIFSLRED